MDRLGELISVLDHALNSRRKRHITGGILMSVSLLFGGLALTILTVKNNEDEETYDELYLE